MDKIYKSCVLFDMDGVIIDSEPMQMEAFTILMGEFGLSVNQEDFMSLVGRRALDNFAYLITKYDLKDSPEHLVYRKNEIYDLILHKNLHSIEGIPELVRYLASLDIPLGLVSGSVRKHVDFVLNGLELAPFFKVTLASEDVVNGKPDPEGFLRAARELGADPKESFVIEDTEPGVLAGVNGGFKVIAIPTEFTRPHDFSRAWKEVASPVAALHLFKDLFH